MSDWTRGDDPVYDGYRESWKEQAEAEYEADRAEEEERNDIIVGITTARLRELADAERDGRVVVLPCKVGDTVFIDTEGFMGMHLPHMPMEVKRIVAELYGDWGDCKQTQYVSLEELATLATEPKGEHHD